MRTLPILLLVAWLTAGCVSAFSGVCAMMPLGQNEQGVVFARVQCEKMQDNTQP